MKKEDLFEAMGNIDEKFITEAPEIPAKKRFPGRLPVLLAAAAALLLITGIGIFGLKGRRENQGIVYAYTPIEKHVSSADFSDSAVETGELYEIPHWEDMPDVQRFNSLSYTGNEYRTALILVHAENVGDLLGNGTLTGQDVYDNDRIHEIEGTVYQIAGIVPEAAVCVVFPDEPDRAYAYVNADYQPATLGQFMEDLGFSRWFGTRHVTVNRYPEKDVVFEDIDTQTVLDMLLSDASLVNEPGHTGDETLLTISANLNIIGNHYKVMTLTKTGYLWTNLLESEKCFYVGEEKAEAFLREVVEHHQGFLYIYDIYDGLTGEIIGTAAEQIGNEEAESVAEELITGTTKPAE
ncbi:MAG: hypothetical protein IJL43_00060 [Lachnospiraceae bacterium]|nr:hypothetical protein [Lachnospiraceae bacterium]